jgi:acetyltransferase-like isoleucine patch superfamily enzyme
MKPIIHPTAIIGPNVTIEDDVFIGPYCVIGTHAEYRSKVNERTDEPGRCYWQRNDDTGVRYRTWSAYG